MRRPAKIWVAVASSLCLVLGAGVPSAAFDAQVGSLYIDMAPRPNGAIGVVGDSLTFAYFAGLDDSLRAQQWGPMAIEARSGRRTIVPVYTASWSASSGLDALRRLRASGFDASIWLIALGTNDTYDLAGNPAAIDALIDTMIAEIGAGRRVVWVNVFAKSTSAKARAVEFNGRLSAATTRHSLLSIADWFTLASANLSWFVDDVHTNAAGAIARNEFVAQAALVPRCPLAVPPTPTPLPAPSPAAVATATAVATHRCRV